MVSKISQNLFAMERGRFNFSCQKGARVNYPIALTILGIWS